MKGTTLIETLVYIALLSMLMVGVFSSVYIVISFENQTNWVLEDVKILIKNPL